MALVYVDSDPWLKEHEDCEKLYREIMEQLTARSLEQKTSHLYASLSSAVRLRMKQYSSEVQQLQEKLRVASLSSMITRQEAERRSRLVEQLQSREVQMQQLFVDRDTFGERNRSRLLQQNPAQSSVASGRTVGWADEDIYPQGSQNENLSVDELRQQQQRMVQAQDQGLDELSKIISRQKQIAVAITDEVEFQNEVIDDLADHMDRTDARVVDGTRQIRVVGQKDKTWVIGFSCCVKWTNKLHNLDFFIILLLKVYKSDTTPIFYFNFISVM
ncbi:syntaxin-8 isoform X2 [Schistocerca gregaria]|uniref:syntaxin-8 isoform X2 n=1 Tax=Schistocerca gregaria TaxID=7010 RepID=UPI00211E0114|nr:syntaxin-8 isoform X2 [Schistocerca gregaria]